MLTTSAPITVEPSLGCPDELSRDNVIARRNVLAGLWAGRLIGLPDAALGHYAVEVHRSDFAVSGDADVVDKLTDDLNGKGLPIPPHVVREKLSGFHREAWMQLHATD